MHVCEHEMICKLMSCKMCDDFGGLNLIIYSVYVLECMILAQYIVCNIYLYGSYHCPPCCLWTRYWPNTPESCRMYWNRVLSFELQS